MTTNLGRKNGRYAVEVGGKHIAPSVTTVIGKLDKPGLSWAAAKETALYAVDHMAAWADLPRDVAYETLRHHHRKVWDDKRDRGSAVHDMAADWAAGRDVACPPDCEGYLDALEAFYAEAAPTVVAAERCVVRADAESSYGGCFDAVSDINDGPFAGRRLLIDIKTGKRYPAEAVLQLAAYRHADGMGIYDADGVLVAIEAMPPCIDGTAILYLHDDGTYELLEVPGDEVAFADFLALRRIHAFGLRMGRWERAHPEVVAAPVAPVVSVVARPQAPVNIEAMVA